jgi:hypothetical protein
MGDGYQKQGHNKGFNGRFLKKKDRPASCAIRFDH